MNNTLNTSNSGNLPKEIIILKDRRYLLKSNTIGSFEVISEYIASRIFKYFQIPTIEYEIITLKEINDYGIKLTNNYIDKIFSICEIENIDLIPLYQVLRLVKTVNIQSSDILKIGFTLNVPQEDIVNLYKIYIIDALIGNEDRHLSNIDLYRLDNKWRLGPALDFGASLLYNVPEWGLGYYDETNIGPDKSKPFLPYHNLQIQYLQERMKEDNIEVKINTKKYRFESELDIIMKPIINLISNKRYNAIQNYILTRYNYYIKRFENTLLEWTNNK